MVAPCPSCSLGVPRCLAVDSWEPGIRDHPHHPCVTRSTHLLFCTGTPTSYRNPECCLGIIFVIADMAPLSFRHGDQMLHIMFMSTFNKNCIKLAHVFRIMIITFKCLRLLLHQIDNCIWGFTGFVVCYIRSHLNCLDGVVLVMHHLLPC